VLFVLLLIKTLKTNHWLSQFFIGFVLSRFLCYDFVFLEEVGKFLTISFWLKVLFTLAVTEVCFTLGHSLLHQTASLMELHIFHHCNTVERICFVTCGFVSTLSCQNPSFLTNLLFNPIDLNIEFGGGAIFMLLLHFFVFKDPFLLIITYIIFQVLKLRFFLLVSYAFKVWYMWDHDENLKFPHVFHHTRVDSLYAIYLNVKGDARRNILRPRMAKLVQLDK